MVIQAMNGLALFCERKNLYQDGYSLFAEGISPWHKWEGDEQTHGRLRLRQALFAHHLARYDESQKFCKQGEGLLGKKGTADDRATILFLTGSYSHALADFETAEVSFKKGLAVATNEDGLHRLADMQMGFARALSEMGKYEEEQMLLDEAYRFFDTTQDLTQLARVQVLLASLSQKRDLQDQSEVMLQATLPLLEDAGGSTGCSAALFAVRESYGGPKRAGTIVAPL